MAYFSQHPNREREQMTIEQIIQAAIQKRIDQGLTVSTVIDGQEVIRHCGSEAQRNAYIGRCQSRGQETHVVNP
jgi:hypothetical protein